MPVAKITSKGQITIPSEIRKQLGLNAGDRISFQVRNNSEVLFYPETVDVLTLCGVIDPEKKGVSIKDMNEIIRDRSM
ncbi:MAG: AbrB/MazE/SpoVT family DNA-binding domain-containing protein [Candidatus Electryonea clarkiae]|nr:AbrB/MazE/SpoVT family DNA-binding domain-containing protein [Candidatus Electryonea clarkiae]MDP8288983.1 AbrB/MazE/SpoVT family DNA-binding domain-containing protein [Candidatus Electryonea clarkiae]